MRRTLRISALSALVVLTAVSTFAQARSPVGTVIDVDEGRGRLQLEYDDQSRITIETDSVSTVYYGFGSMIAGKPEIFTGSSGLSNVRLGDRVEVRGAERGQGIVKAERVTLLGRDVAASPTGVGTTREPTSATMPVDDRAAGTAPARDPSGAVEGTIRSINGEDGRLVILTQQRRLMTVRTYRSTPVIFQNESYSVSNLEVGDRIRVEAEARSAQAADEIVARRITVVQSVQDTAAPAAGGNVTTISGRVSRIEPGLDRVYVDNGREEIRVDMAQAEDGRGEAIRAADVRIDEPVEITGSFNRVGDIFNASTFRFTDPNRDSMEVPNGRDVFERPALITTGGTLMETLDEASTLGVRETDTNDVVRVWASADLVVRLKAGTYTTVNSLRVNDSVLVQAYRDARGNLIAQTIRLRNR